MMPYRDFLEAGITVIGIHPIKDGKCSCDHEDCANAGKHPISRNYQHSPLWSDEQLEAFEELGHFSTGYGVLCRGLLVVDVDARNGGMNSLEKLLQDVPEISAAGLIVATGSGGGSKHLYFKVPEDAALVTKLQQYPGIDFKSSGFVIGPGSLHASGNTYNAVVGTPFDIEPAPESLVALLRKPERVRTEFSGCSLDVSMAEVQDMLNYIEADDYDVWVKVGMVLHELTGGSDEGQHIWDKWSQKSKKYKAFEVDFKWHSFGKSINVVSFGTLAFFAEQGGWTMPVEFNCDELFDDNPNISEIGLPFDISDIDILRPPGLVGEVAKYINSCTRRKREHLAVGAALTAIGNIIGLNYIDDYTNCTGNLFTFNVAGSGTGKEAVQQAMFEIMRVAGLAPACHGSIKSEQEIIRNISIRHQAAFYIIDEFGVMMNKIANSTKAGGASYLEGVVGQLMSIFTKADGYQLITGDHKEDVKEMLSKEIARLRKFEEDGDPRFNPVVMESLTTRYNTIDHGIKNPFVSMAGFTTPETFYNCVTKDNATNGFFSRAIFFIEHDTTPPLKENFKKADLPEALKNAIISLSSNGSFDISNAYRIEQKQERTRIKSTTEAIDALNRIALWCDQKAEEEVINSGLESMYLRFFELVAKVSFIICAPSGLRTIDHVKYAFALVLSDIKRRMLVVQSSMTKELPTESYCAAIMAKIGDEGIALGKLKAKLRPKKPEDIENALEYMESKGQIRHEERSTPKLTKFYFLIR